LHDPLQSNNRNGKLKSVEYKQKCLYYMSKIIQQQQESTIMQCFLALTNESVYNDLLSQLLNQDVTVQTAGNTDNCTEARTLIVHWNQ